MIYGMQRFFAFKFYNDSAVYHEVGSKLTFQLYSAVNQGALLFAVRREGPFLAIRIRDKFRMPIPEDQVPVFDGF
jgi:hypothetical protein